MKKLSTFALVVGLMASGVAFAQQMTEADLTREAINKTMSEASPAERREEARKIIAAIEAMDIDDEAKVNMLISASRAMISGSKSGNAIGVMAEIYARVSVKHLVAVSSSLMEAGFGQKDNGLTDEQMTTFISTVLKSASDYLVNAGCDAPSARAGIMTAAFIGAAENTEAATAAANDALNPNIRTAAMTYANDILAGSTSLIAQGAGVDEDFTAKPEVDPDQDHITVVEIDDPTATAETPDFSEEVEDDADEIAEDIADTPYEADDSDVKVPLISRFSNDIEGIVSDTMASTLYDWETLDPKEIVEDPLGAALMGVGRVDVLPGEAETGAGAPSDDIIIEDSSDLYDGQR